MCRSAIIEHSGRGGPRRLLPLVRPAQLRRPVTARACVRVRPLERLVDGESRGDPELPLRWTAKSVREARRSARRVGSRVHFTTVAKLLRGLGYSLQANPGGETAVRPPALMWDATLGV